MNGSRYFGKFMTNINSRQRITTYTNCVYFSTMLSFLRGQRLPIAIFSLPSSFSSSIESTTDSKPTLSLKELFSLLLTIEPGSVIVSKLSLLAISNHCKGLQVQCMGIRKMNIIAVIDLVSTSKVNNV